MKFNRSYYEILDLEPGATEEEVKRAYRTVRDTFGSSSSAIYSLYSPEETEAIASKLDEAFRVLTDRDRRRRYDRYLDSTSGDQPLPSTPDELMDSLHDLGELEALEEEQGLVAAVDDGNADEESSSSAVVSVEVQLDDAPRITGDPETASVSVASLEPFDDWSEEAAIDARSEDLHALRERAVVAPRRMEARPLRTPDPDASGGERGEDSTTSARIRSWSRDLASGRRAKVLAVKLLPLTEEAMADLASGRTISGAELRYLRKMRGVDLHTISERTKISAMTLRFIEQDRFDNLPAPIYLRGFVDQYVRLLDLPPDTVDQYMNGLPARRH